MLFIYLDFLIKNVLKECFTCLNAGRLSIISCFSLGQNRSILLQKRVVAYEVLKEIVFGSILSVLYWPKVKKFSVIFGSFNDFFKAQSPKQGPCTADNRLFFSVIYYHKKKTLLDIFPLISEKKFLFEILIFQIFVDQRTDIQKSFLNVSIHQLKGRILVKCSFLQIF